MLLGQMWVSIVGRMVCVEEIRGRERILMRMMDTRKSALRSIERKLCQKMRGDKRSKDKEENDRVTMRRPDVHQVAMQTYVA